jgi:hypothetical protein
VAVAEAATMAEGDAPKLQSSSDYEGDSYGIHKRNQGGYPVRSEGRSEDRQTDRQTDYLLRRAYTTCPYAL